MATIEDATKILRALKPKNIEEEDEVFKFDLFDTKVKINKKEIDDYIQIRIDRNHCSDTTLYYPGYYEQAIEIQGRGPISNRIFRDSGELSLIHEQTKFRVTISQISANFIFFVSDSDSTDKNFRRSIMRRHSIYRDGKALTLSDIFSRIITIKVFPPQGHALFSNFKLLRTIAESSLFNISYGYGVGIIPIQSWDRTYHTVDSGRKELAQFPLRSYNQELVAYYQMSIDGESLILSFLSLYKILEYFFTLASEHLLHKKIKEQLVSPDFSHTKVHKLRELAKIIRRFDQKMDERKMLQTVLEEYLDKEDLKNWITDYDKENGNHYTEERSLFGEIFKIDISENQIYPSVSNRIYHIRNVLVHNKEGELSRFIPFSGQEKILVREVPLLKYVAEVLIIKNGKDIQL